MCTCARCRGDSGLFVVVRTTPLPNIYFNLPSWGMMLLTTVHGWDVATRPTAAACLRMECAYQYAWGVGKDEARALQLYRLAAAQGERYAKGNLGHMHLQGLGGLTASVPEGLRWLTKAANQGCANSQFSVGALHYRGTGGVPRDYKRALFWMQLGATGGLAQAKQSLAAFQARCTGTCRAQSNAMVKAFRVQDACEASLFTRANHCGGNGDPTPE